MIVKDLDPSVGATPQVRSGRRAEEQMAHYLKRAFGSNKDILILNDLRLVAYGEVAQIDHLVIFRWGFVIVESKSVTQTVSVNEYAEWVRVHVTGRQGMPSPIEQARRQAEFLHAYLLPHGTELLTPGTFSKALGLLSPEHADAVRERIRTWFGIHTFAGVAQEILVAISDDAIIERPSTIEIPEVCKADQVPGRIKAIVSRYRKANSLLTIRANPFNTADVVCELSSKELSQISDFLLSDHRPLRGHAPSPRTTPAICTVCGVVVDSSVRRYCLDRSARFGGNIYCRDHQLPVEQASQKHS